MKAIQPALEDSLRKESELNGRPYAQQIKEMDEMLLSRRQSLADSVVDADGSTSKSHKLMNGVNHSTPKIHQTNVQADGVGTAFDQDLNYKEAVHERSSSPHDVSMIVPEQEDADENEDLVTAGSIAQLNGELSANTEQGILANTPPASMNGTKKDADIIDNRSAKPRSPTREPPTPPISLVGNQQPATVEGGIPWWAEPFDPEGTTIHDERWTGPEVLRGMSEELSEMDDDELQCLGGADLEVNILPVGGSISHTTSAASTNLKKNGKRKNRWKGYRR